MPIYEALPQTLLALNGLSTLQERVGNQAWAGASDDGVWGRVDGAWIRVEGASSHPIADVSTSMTDARIDTSQGQLGFQTTLVPGPNGSALVGGVTFRYGQASASVSSVFGGGTINTHSEGVGGTLTWYGPNGFYVDGQAQFSVYSSDLKSSILARLVQGDNGAGEAGGVEIGKRTPLGDGFSITPQVQTVYSHVSFHTFTDPAGAIVSDGRSESLQTRAGLSVDHQRSWTDAAGKPRQAYIYGVADVTYEWLGGTQTIVSGTPLDRRTDRLWARVGLGGTYSWDRFSFYSEVTADTGVDHFGQRVDFKGTAGFRVKF